MSAELVRHTPIVLYLSITGGGAAHSLLNMILSVKGKVKPIVVFPDRNGIYQKFIEHGIMCLVVPFEQEVFYKNFFQSLPIWRKPVYIAGKMRHFLLRNIIFNSRVKKALKGERIDIVHTNTGTISIGVSLAEALGAKHVWHLREFQDKDFGAKPFWGWKRFHRLLFKADGIIAITKAVADHFGILENHPQACVMWNAVAKTSQAVRIYPKENYIFFAAAVVSPGKGLDDLIQAYSQSVMPAAGCALKIAGDFNDSNYQERILHLIDSYCIGSMVEFLGFCGDAGRQIQKAKAVVMPSHSEALGRVAVEAMFNGTVAIARNSGGPSEFMINGCNGFLFNTIDELTDILNHVYASDMDALVNRAQQYAIDNFSEEVYGEKLMNLYRSIISE